MARTRAVKDRQHVLLIVAAVLAVLTLFRPWNKDRNPNGISMPAHLLSLESLDLGNGDLVSLFRMLFVVVVGTQVGAH